MLRLSQILGEMERMRDPASYDSFASSSIKKNVVPKNGTILFEGSVKGTRKSYVVAVEINGVDFKKSPSEIDPEDEDDYVKDLSTGKAVYHNIPTTENPMRVSCSCDDFGFRWSYPLFKKKSLIGGYREYKRRTPPPEKGGRPYVNPDDVVGVCKHLYSFLWVLINKKEIKD